MYVTAAERMYDIDGALDFIERNVRLLVRYHALESMFIKTANDGQCIAVRLFLRILNFLKRQKET